MDIVWFGQQEWDKTWTEKQQLSTRLARRGHRVLYVDPHPQADPAPILPSIRSIATRDDRLHLRRTGPNGLSVFSYRPLPPLRWRGNRWWQRRALRRILHRMAMRDPLAMVMTPTARATVDELDPWATVYYAVDEWTSFWPDEERPRVRADEEALLRRSSLALAVSHRLVERFRTIQPNSHLLDNAADIEHFSPGMLERAPELPELAAIDGPCVGFLGQVDGRFDQELMAAIADRHPEWQIVIVGRVKHGLDVRVLEERSNINFVPFKAFHELPSVLKHFDVCVIPYRPIERSHACSPSKAFEYLATGKPVITTPIRTYATVGHALRMAEGIEAWETAIGEALADPDEGRSLRLECARLNGWEDRVDRLEALLEEVRSRASAEGRGPRNTLESPRRPLRQGAVAAFCGRIPLENDPEVGEVSARYRVMHVLSVLVGAARRLVSRRRTPSPKKILFARRAWLGDLVVAIPALRRLRQVFPDAHVTLGVQEGAPGLDILRFEGLVDDTVVLDFLSAERLRDRLRGAWAFLRIGWDITICGSRRMMLREAFLSGARLRVGLWDGSEWQRFNSVVLARDNTHHEMESNLLLVDAIALMEGRASENDTTGTVLPVVHPPDAPVDRLLRDVGIPADAPLLVMHPGSKRTTRRWPFDRFARLATHILEERPEFHVVWTGTPSERDGHEQLRKEIPEALRPRAPSVAGHTSLPMLFALLRRARVVVSNDTGVMHAARASGVPLVALLGPGEARRWSPAPMGTAPAVALRAVVPCAPCLKDQCGSHFCMRSLPEADVLEEVERMIENGTVHGDDHAVRWRTSNLSWESLEAAGFRLPAVRAAKFGYGETGSIQRYPALAWEPLSGDDAAGHFRGWATLVREPVPDFVALGARPTEWRPEALELATAALFREPEHHAVVGIAAERRGAVPGYERSRKWGVELFDTSLVLVRASAFRAFLERIDRLPRPDDRGMAELNRRLVRDPAIRVALLDEPLTGPR